MSSASQLPDLRPIMVAERNALLELLGNLDESDWDRPTECSGWDAKGIALHLVGDDLSLLSRQRDGAPSGVRAVAARRPDLGFIDLLNTFNEEWVQAASFVSASTVMDLLRTTGQWTADFYAARDLEDLGERVFWAGPDPAPYRLIIAREYSERWIHHLQIARATGKPGPVASHFLVAAISSVCRVLATQLGKELCGESRIARIEVEGLASWSFAPGADGRWFVADEVAPSSDACCAIAREHASGAFSFGMTRAQLESAWIVIGSNDEGRRLQAALVKGLSRR